MSDYIDEGAVKVVEIIGISKKSFEDAVNQAIEKASKSITGITGIEILKHAASVKNGKISHYRVDVKLAFSVK